MTRYKILLIVFGFMLLFYPFNLKIFAQSTLGIARYYLVSGDKPTNGDIVLREEKKILVSQEVDAPSVFGVVSEKSAMVFGKPKEGYYPIVIEGEVVVKVVDFKEIKIGDYLVTSDKPGIARVFDLSKDNYPFAEVIQIDETSDFKDLRFVKVRLMNLKSKAEEAAKHKSNIVAELLDKLSLSNVRRYETPSEVLRYFFAAGIILVSFVLSFITFRKVAAKGVEAMGRNPLAGKLILFHLALNIFFTFMILIVGILLSYVVLSF